MLWKVIPIIPMGIGFSCLKCIYEELTYLFFKEMIRIQKPDIIEKCIYIYTKYTQSYFIRPNVGNSCPELCLKMSTALGAPSFGLRPNIHSSENSRIPAFEAEGGSLNEHHVFKKG